MFSVHTSRRVKEKQKLLETEMSTSFEQVKSNFKKYY